MTHRSSHRLPPCRLALTLAAAAFWMLTGFSTAAPSEGRRTAIVIAVENAKDSIVNIHGQKTVGPADEGGRLDGPRRVNGMGTGVVVDPRGYIITNYHVVEGVRKIEVTLASGDNYVATLVANDPTTDLAVIKIPIGNKKLPVINIGTSSDLMIGEPVIAVGNAYGYENTVTRGIVSALHRSVQVSDAQSYEDLIQTDASINPGNSGGPLLNIDGQMIGINVAVRAGAQGIGFAIPADKAMTIAAKLMSAQRLENCYVGLQTKDQVGTGLVVSAVDKTGPAAEGGLQAGDVITGVADQNVARALDLERALLGRKTGEKVDVTVKRKGEEMTLAMTVGNTSKRSAPTSTPAPAAEADPSWDLLGLRLATIAPQQFKTYGSRYRGGLRVSDVRADSPAAKQGIRRGDILVGMHVWETIALDNVAYVLNRPDFSEIEPIKFYILRGSETLYGHLPVAMNKK